MRRAPCPASARPTRRSTEAPAIQARIASGAAAGYRSAFRVEGDRIVLVDQRRLPAALIEIECRTAIDVANEMRDLTVRGGPVLGQVAAAGLALSAHRARASRPYARRAILRAAATTLVNARPTPRHVAAAVDRVMARYEAIGDLDEDGDRIADAIQAESDAIIYEALDDHSRIAGAAADQLSRPEGRPLGILTLGSTGAMGSGQFGTALGAIQSAVYRGHEVHVYVLEGRPWLDGARVASWELAQAQIPHTLVADSAAGWLLASGRVDVVLVGAERIARNGDVANDVGTYPVAVLASRHGVPFIVCSPLAAVDSAAADGSTFPLEERPADDLIRIGGIAVAPGGTPVLNPVADTTPAALITGIATEEGFLAPNAMALAMAGTARARRTAVTRTAPVGRGRRPQRRRRGRLMAEVAITGRRGHALVARPITDRARLRDFLEQDRLFAAYALCDLEDREFARTRWGAAWADDQLVAVVLEYAGLSPQPLFVLGDSDGIERILADLIRPRAAYVAALSPQLAAVSAAYRVDPGPPMVRMWVDRAHFRPYPAEVQRLLPVEIGELNRLYQLGFASWLPASAISEGVYFGIRVGGRLVSAAGTHVISPGARLAVVGNVLTLAQFRGRGYATAVTGAVTAELLRTCDQVVLNVRSDNPPALQAYRRLGYQEHVRFEERLIHRLGPPWPNIGPLRRLFAHKESPRR